MISNYKRKESYQFSDYFIRMYPDLMRSAEKFESEYDRPHVRVFTFQVTDSCNLSCTYCYQICKGNRVMSFEDAKLCIDKMLSGDDNFDSHLNTEMCPAIILEFIGGEPFKEIDLINKIVNYFRMKTILLNHPWRNNYMISFTTNGTYNEDPKVMQFLWRNRQHMSLSVTVDGTKELHDMCRIFPDGSPTYDIAHKAAKYWLSTNYALGSKITISPENLVYLEDCLKQMISDGYKEIHANPVYEAGWTYEHATEYYYKLKNFIDEWLSSSSFDMDIYLSILDDSVGHPLSEEDNNNWCGGTGNMLALDPDGDIYPCIRYMRSSLGNDIEPLTVGNVNYGLAVSDKHKNQVANLNCITRRSQSKDSCFYCPIAAGCAWCSAYNYQVTGDVNHRVTYICVMHQARVLAVNYYYNSLVKRGITDSISALWIPEKWALNIIPKEEYDMLCTLANLVGAYINKGNITQLKYKPRYHSGDSYVNPEDIIIIEREGDCTYENF